MFLVKISPATYSALSLDNGCVFLVKDYRKPMYKSNNRVYIFDYKDLGGLAKEVNRIRSEAQY